MNALLQELSMFPPGEAIFDLDGTLIHGDIGESVLRRLGAAGHRNAVTDGIDDLWAHYRNIASYEGQCRFAAEALAGLSVGEIERFVDDAFAGGDVSPVAATCELAHAISRRHRVWILTGSAELLGRAAAPRLGITHAVGLRISPQTGQALTPITCGEGKVRATWTWFGKRPVFAIGDSPHDLPLLRLAHVARTCGKNAGVEFPAFPEAG